MQNRENVNQGMRIGFTLLIIWVVMACTIDAFKNPELTDNQRFIRIPRTITLDFVK